MARPDAALIAAEMTHAAGLLGFACRLGSARLESRYEGVVAGRAGAGWSPAGRIADILPAERKSLAGELAGLIAEYRRLWQARSRPGGLVDSAGRLAWVQDLLRGP
jgi:hypothetical protein